MFKPKKSLGQNFLKSEKIAREIVEAGNVDAEDIILEVGPGRGILTEELLKKAKKVIAVEKDKRLAEFLKTNFAEEIQSGKLEIVSGDILKFNPSGYSLAASGYKIIANIPYYITSRFLRTFLESDIQPSLMVLMTQKEVAERIVAKSKLARRRGGESLLSISVKAYGKPEIVKKVPSGNFYPKPKVDSAIIKISDISKYFFKNISPSTSDVEGAEKKFFETVKTGFSHKRKILINNLKVNQEVFKFCGINDKARAENVSLEQWKCLSANVKDSP